MAKAPITPLLRLLCSVFLFSSNVLAVSAVLGIDLGTEYFKASLVKPGIPLDIVLTKDSRRKEASAVAFKPPQNGPKAGSYPERAYGSDAMALAARYPGDVYPNLKTLLGLPTDTAIVAEYAARHPALQLGAHSLRKTATFKSPGAFTPDEEPFLVEELLAMELQSIQKNAEAMAGSTVRSTVITVPPFFTAEEKRTVELAAELAGLRVLSLISDGLAVGLHYATSRTFPNINQGAKPEHHMVFDMGAGSAKATIMKFQSRTVKDVGKFNKTVQEIQVLSNGWDRTLGGDALNYLILDDMVAQFTESPAAKKVSATVSDVKAHGRAIAKLSKEAERVRHVLSANQATGASFEALYDDVDFRYKLTRTDFETMAQEHAKRVVAVVKEALDKAGLDAAQLDSVVLHGGATRTPFVQQELEKLFDADRLRTNVNADEAAVFGAGFRAAEISPSFRVKEIRVADCNPYTTGMRWQSQSGKAQHQRLWSSVAQIGGPPKELTFTNKEDFTVDFYQQLPPLAPETGSDVETITKVLTTKNLTATVAELKEKYSCEPADVQFKVSVKLSADNGEVEVVKAALQCEIEVQEKEGFVDGVKNLFGFGKKDDQKPIDGEASGSSSSSTKSSSSSAKGSSSSSAAGSSASVAADEAANKIVKKTVSIPVQHELTKAGIPQLSKADVKALKDRLKAFEASDKARMQRDEALNQLEGFTYRARDLLENDNFIKASTATERSSLEKLASDASEWLYGDGVDASKEELKKRLKELTAIADPIQNRIDENKKRPELVAGLQDALEQTVKFVGNIKKEISDYEAFKSAEAASPSTSSESSSTTLAPSQGDFGDLEDDDAKSTTKTPTMEDVVKERGPVPPLYTMEDLVELEELHKTIKSWLDGKEAEQKKLAETDNPVLLVADLTSRRAKLDKAGMALTMKGVKNFEAKKKTSSKSKPKKAAKKGKGGDKQDPVKIELGKDGKMPTQEELEELLKQMGVDPNAEDGKASKEEAPKEKTRVHEEL
ncbi:hypothetical protein RB597_009831 [Gaeumannomyces tritici]